jgi:phosphatidylinositol glycan class W
MFPENTYHDLGQASVSLYAEIQTRLQPLGFLSSWLVLVLPLLLSMTLFANQPTVLLVLLSVFTGLLLYLPKSWTPLPLRQPLVSSTSTSGNPVRNPFLHALTTYRAHMMLVTVLAIVAVDFPVFPRSLVKCETFGVSLV